MLQGTQAEIFIEVLAEMLAEERAYKATRSLNLARAQADRFLSRSFGGDAESNPTSSRHATQAAESLSQTI